MTILVVDDEKDIKALFEQRFRREIRDGVLTFAFCYSGEEALDWYRETTSLNVILILSDINMPGMSGLELLRRIRELAPLAPPFMMMITAYNDLDKQETAMRLGADDFLQKPIDFDALKSKLVQLK